MITKINSIRLAWAVIAALAAATVSSQAQSATATISWVLDADESDYDYTITLQNTGDFDLNSFWYGWTRVGNNLPSDPYNAGNSLGWDNDLDGNSIMWVNNSGDPLSVGDSATFTFTSSDSPSAITTAPSGGSVAYTGGIDFSQNSPGDSTDQFYPALINPAPSVNITSPANGATFTAPASVHITASGSVSGGIVTNIAFFATNGSTTISVGSVKAASGTVTAANLAAGSYSLAAVATAGGVSATSAVVHITVKPAPTVSITNPVAGTVFSAPVILKLGATAAVATGSVTNVVFVATNSTSTNVLGSVQASPFNVTGSSLGAGNYSLLAVATAAGISTTSAVVNVSVVTPVAVSASTPAVATGQFSFSYSVNVGLTYVVQRSPDLSTWTPVATNVATVNPSQFTESAAGSGARYYQVVLQPNP